MKQIIKQIHLWLSLPAGIFLTLICITGAILSFETEITETIDHDKYYNNTPLTEVMNLDSLVALVNKQLINDTVTGLKVYHTPERNVSATLSSGQRVSTFVNPYTAEVVGKGASRSGFMLQTMLLHRWLMLPNRTTGKIIVGISTIFMIFILITGIIRWIPKKKNLVQNLWFKWKKAKFNRKNLDLHKILGLYASILLLLMCVTGLMWSFEWYKNVVAKIFGIEVATAQPNKSTAPKTSTIPNTFSWQEAFDKTASLNPNYDFIQISKSGDISLLAQDASHNRATDKYKLNKKDQSVALVAQYNQQNNTAYLMSESYTIHVGSWNIWTKILWFLAAIIGASLPITGYIFYFKRKGWT